MLVTNLQLFTRSAVQMAIVAATLFAILVPLWYQHRESKKRIADQRIMKQEARRHEPDAGNSVGPTGRY